MTVVDVAELPSYDPRDLWPDGYGWEPLEPWWDRAHWAWVRDYWNRTTPPPVKPSARRRYGR